MFAIDVYPAATLIAHKMHVPGYKRKNGQEARRELFSKLWGQIGLPADTYLLENNDDALDAAVDFHAGADYLRGRSLDQGISRLPG